MSNGTPLSLQEIEDRMAIVRDNIRQLIEQATAQSGAGDKSRNADRLADQQAELDRLTKERDALLKRTKRNSGFVHPDEARNGLIPPSVFSPSSNPC